MNILLQNIESVSGTKYEPVLIDNAYKIHMKLTIRAVSKSDFGTYKCISKNSLGETDGTIKLYGKLYTSIFLHDSDEYLILRFSIQGGVLAIRFHTMRSTVALTDFNKEYYFFIRSHEYICLGWNSIALMTLNLNAI